MLWFAAALPAQRLKRPLSSAISLQQLLTTLQECSSFLGPEGTHEQFTLEMLDVVSGKVADTTEKWDVLTKNNYENLPKHTVEKVTSAALEQAGVFCKCAKSCNKSSDCPNHCSSTLCSVNNCSLARKKIVCGNQINFRNSLVEVGFSGDKDIGSALFACEVISPGQKICEYTGVWELNEPITPGLGGYCVQARVDSKIWGTNTIFLDARVSGSVARFANHSHHPNARLHWFFGENQLMISLLICTETIHKGSAITISYDKTVPFRCGCKSFECPSTNPQVSFNVSSHMFRIFILASCLLLDSFNSYN